MRIALVSQEYPPETGHGGIGTQTYAKAHGLASLGHDVQVVSHSTDDAMHRYRDGAVHVMRIPGPDVPMNTEVARWVTYSAEVAATVAELHVEAPLDLVDFPEYGAEGYVHLLNRTPWHRIPTVIHLHGPLVMLANTIGWPEMDSELYRTGTVMEAACLRLADAVFSSSGCSADWCARHYGLEATDVPVLHTGVDTAHFRPPDVRTTDRPTIVSVGKLVWNKGVGELLEAALELAFDLPSLRLRMIGPGEGDVIRALRERAADAGRPELLELTGYVSREALPAKLADANVFAAPSRYEGGPGFACLEAMACGLPVVACKGSGVEEIIHSEENGLLVPPENVDALTTALRRLLVNTDAGTLMGRHARQYVEREADTTICLRRLESFYGAIAAQNYADAS